MEVYLLNTGRVGGKADDDRSKKVTIPVSSAIVKSIAEQSIKWDQDPDFGYEVAEEVPGVDDAELLQPRRLYERQGRMDEKPKVGHWPIIGSHQRDHEDESTACLLGMPRGVRRSHKMSVASNV